MAQHREPRTHHPNMPLRSLLDLNHDVMHEIFRHFVAIDSDGPFLLILVSVKCRDWVLSKPILWSWVVVDEIKPDWPERALVCAALSRDLPLYVILRTQTLDVNTIQHIAQRCVALFVETPRVHAFSQRDAPRNALLPYHRSFYVKNKMVFKDMDSMVMSFLAASPPGQIHTFIWSGACATHSTWDIHDMLLANKTLLETLDRSSLVGVTTLLLASVKHSRQQISLAVVWPWLPLLPHLRILELSDSFLRLEETIDLPIISLNSLHTLAITPSTFVEKDARRPNVVEVLGRLCAPKISQMITHGLLTQVKEALKRLGDNIRPPELNLEICLDKHYARTHNFALKSDFMWLRCLTIELYPSPGLGLGLRPGPSTMDPPGNLKSMIQPILRILPTGGSLRLIGGIELSEMVKIAFMRPWVIEMAYVDGTFSTVFHEGQQKPAHVEFPPYRIHRLALQSKVTHASFHNQWLCPAESVSIGHGMFVKQLLMGPQSEWFSGIEKLDIDLSLFYPSQLNNPDPPINRDRLIHINSLRCSPHVAAYILRYFDTPRLTSLTLNNNTPLGIIPISTVLMHLGERAFSLAELVTLGFEDAPEWSALTGFLRDFRSSEGGGISKVKLTTLPHPRILHSIVAALRGARREPQDSWEDAHDEEADPNGVYCQPCAKYGWRRDNHYGGCPQHLKAEMVSITAYTL